MNVAKEMMIRRSTNLRSLTIEYPRNEGGHTILAALTNRNHSDIRFNLPVVKANADGISLKLPALITGMFELKIQDGKQSISKWIALQ